MTATAVRRSLLLTSLVSLSLIHLLLPTQANQPASVDPKVLDSLVCRNIGPANMGGRVTDIEGVESNPNIVYVATASGGLWKTTDGGTMWAPIFDNQSSVCIGDIDVSKSNPNIVWVGTGEHNPRNSVAWGDGVYKSVDGGKTWQHMGLKDSHSTGRVIIHPTNPDIVYVGVLGHLWGPNKERGVFKTADGGKTWEVSKFWDEDTGIIDMKMDPSDPNTLYACAYCCRRDGFSGGNPATVIGPHAGIYKTSDGGKNWEKLTVATPESTYGRCGITIHRKDPNIVYAIVQTDKTPSGNSNQGGSAGAGDRPALGGIFRSDDKGKTWKHLNTLCPRPMYFGELHVDPIDEKRLYCHGVSMSLSNDGGKTWQGAKAGHADGHAVWINPKDNKEVWVGNDGGFVISKNRAQSFQAQRAMTLCQFYGISVDMSKPYYVYGGLQDNGSHGGPSATYTAGGIRQNEWFNVGGGDGFHTLCDPNDPDTIYSESQYGSMRRVNVKGKGSKGKGLMELFNELDELLGQQKADQKKDDPKKDPQKKGGKGGGGGGYKSLDSRFNWSSPMALSPHDSNTVYYGGSSLLMSNDRATTWKKISPDLTYGPAGGMGAKTDPAKKDDATKKVDPNAKTDPQKKGGKGGGGANWAHTLFTIGESPVKKGVLWTGADDGRIMVSRDGGGNWTDVSNIPNVAKDRCVSRVEPSHFDEGGCYVSITRYRNDDRKPYVFKTTNYGETWENITSNLPESGSVHVVIDSSKNKDLLFCGTEFGLFTSFNSGKQWHRIKGGLPTVSVHDIIIHPRDRDLVLGTHGRGIWIYDDISPLESLTSEVAAKAAHLFEVRPAVAFKWTTPGAAKKVEDKKKDDIKKKLDDLVSLLSVQKKGGGGMGGGGAAGPGVFVGENPPYGAIIQYHLKSAVSQPVTVVIQDSTGKKLATLKGGGEPGLHRVVWNLHADGDKEATVQPGDYTAVLEIAGQKLTQTVRVEAEGAKK